jgi:energy-coupling factor transporter ATP-binding protein EcfA2
MRDKARVVVEGLDGSGKSTLVSQLQEIFSDHAYYVRTIGPKPELGRWWMEQLAINPLGKFSLHDRFFYPEIVYGPTLRGKISVDGPTMQYVSEYLRANAFLVYCRPRVETIELGIRQKEQWPGVRENFHQLLKAYDDVMIGETAWYQDRWFRYDWEDIRSLSNLVTALLKYLGYPA